VEAKALPTNDARVVCKFLKSFFARFGAPRAIISDHGTHFCNDQFKMVMRKYEVNHRLSTAYHLQTSGQVEVKENQGKGQNRIKTGQKQEACRSREKSKAVTADRGRKTEQNAKKRLKKAQEKDKIGSKPDKNGKRGEAGKSLKQLRSFSKLSRDQTSNLTLATNPTPKGRIRRSSKQKVENSNFEENPLPPEIPMAENQTMTACPHHGFSELHQLDTFYNALNVNDQDSLNSATADVAELKDMVRALLLDKKNQYSAQTSSLTPAPIKAVEPNCVTCGGNHAYQNCLATSGNVYQDNIQGYVSQAAAANYGQGNTNFRPQMVANQIRPLGFSPVNQPLAYQASAYQAPVSQTQSVSQNDFERYIKANDAVLRNIQNQGQSTQNQCQRSGTLPGNTVTNPKEDLKGITTRRGVAYQRPTTPTPSKVAKQGTEVTTDQVQTLSSQSTAPVQPTVTQSEPETPVSEPVVAPISASMPNLKPSIPYPSSFTDALMLMPKFASTLKALIGNKEKLSEMARTLMNEHCSAVILNKLPKKLGDLGKFLIPYCSVSKPIDIAKDVSTSRALIDIHMGELTIRIEHEAITYNLDQTSRYSANYDQMTTNKTDVTDEACEEYSQEVLGFSDVITSGSPTPSDDPIVSTTSPTLTPFGDSDFLLFEEADAFLGLEDDPDSPELDPSYYDLDGDILSLETILNSDPSPPFLNHEQSVPSFKEELKACEAKMIKSSIDEPPEVELKDLPPHLEYAFLKGDN
nr:reverse transcriptase domain-containing protein [Tanacetum cinerariifolium]